MILLPVKDCENFLSVKLFMWLFRYTLQFQRTHFLHI